MENLGETLGGCNRVAIKVRIAVGRQSMKDSPNNRADECNRDCNACQSIIVTSVVI